MRPFDAPAGSVWAYDPAFVTGWDALDACKDCPLIFVVLEGTYEDDIENLLILRKALFRRGFSLTEGKECSLTDYSRLNLYSERLL